MSFHKIDWSNAKAIPIPADSRFIDLRGKKFWRLSPYELLARGIWRCRCECGNISIARAYAMTRGIHKSCGCYSKQMASRPHGLYRESDTPEWLAWKSIHDRCFNPRHKSYRRYGGRGIGMCDRWKNGDGVKGGFACFLEDMARKPSSRHSLDRRDNDLDYCPSNCRWVLPREQTRNRSNTSWVDFRGVKMTVADVCRMEDVSYSLVKKRLASGFPIDLAISKVPLWRNSR